MNQSSRYLQRGVSSGKEDVHQAIRQVDKGLFPNAFCKVIPDMLTGDPDHCLVMHADGALAKRLPPSGRLLMSLLAFPYGKVTVTPESNRIRLKAKGLQLERLLPLFSAPRA